MESNVDRATAITEQLIDRGAPWSAGTSWQVVLGEGIVAGILGLILLFAPLGGASTILQVIGVVLLFFALVTAFQVWRGRIRPDRTTLAAFRSGSGVTTGLLVLVATFVTGVTDNVTAALAVILGVGFFVFGVVGIAGHLFRRQPEERLPVALLVSNAVLAAIGAILLFSGASGYEAVRGTFNILGILLIIGGVALGGYAYLLRQQEATAAPG
jgi:uncharacterized membrane protein HdeD (DUF308 family)